MKSRSTANLHHERTLGVYLDIVLTNRRFVQRLQRRGQGWRVVHQVPGRGHGRESRGSLFGMSQRKATFFTEYNIHLLKPHARDISLCLYPFFTARGPHAYLFCLLVDLMHNTLDILWAVVLVFFRVGTRLF